MKYLRKTKDYVLVYGSEDLLVIGYTDLDFQPDKNERRSTSRYVYVMWGWAISWRSVKQHCIVNSTTKAEYIVACEATKEGVWLWKFLLELCVVPSIQSPIILYCDNSGAITNGRKPRCHKRSKHIERKYHLIHDIV